jgi:hypothetical protein
VDRPVFLGLELLDLELALDDEAQRRALHAPADRPRRIFFHSSGERLKPTR